MWVGLRLLVQGLEDIDAAISCLGLGGALGEGLIVPERDTERVSLPEKRLVSEIQLLIIMRGQDQLCEVCADYQVIIPLHQLM